MRKEGEIKEHPAQDVSNLIITQHTEQLQKEQLLLVQSCIQEQHVELQYYFWDTIMEKKKTKAWRIDQIMVKFQNLLWGQELILWS